MKLYIAMGSSKKLAHYRFDVAVVFEVHVLYFYMISWIQLSGGEDLRESFLNL